MVKKAYKFDVDVGDTKYLCPYCQTSFYSLEVEGEIDFCSFCGLPVELADYEVIDDKKILK